MPRGGKRAGAGSPPNLDKTIDLLRRQIDWYETAEDERRPVELMLQAVRLNIQVNRLLAMLSIERPPELTQGQRDAAHEWALQAAEDDDK
jgi:hypothetical protein